MERAFIRVRSQIGCQDRILDGFGVCGCSPLNGVQHHDAAQPAVGGIGVHIHTVRVFGLVFFVDLHSLFRLELEYTGVPRGEGQQIVRIGASVLQELGDGITTGMCQNGNVDLIVCQGLNEQQCVIQIVHRNDQIHVRRSDLIDDSRKVSNIRLVAFIHDHRELISIVFGNFIGDAHRHTITPVRVFVHNGDVMNICIKSIIQFLNISHHINGIQAIADVGAEGVLVAILQDFICSGISNHVGDTIFFRNRGTCRSCCRTISSH